MRSGRTAAHRRPHRRARRGLLALAVLLMGGPVRTEPLPLVHAQRYAMGTMIDVMVYHAPREQAVAAIGRAMEEIGRLDRVLSHYDPDSDLSQLVRRGRGGAAVAVDPSLYEVLEQSLAVSRLSGGKFDVTVGPLVKVWKLAQAHGRAPSAADLAAARRCVGYEKLAAQPPNLIRFASDCMDLDLGGIGKGYAVDRAVAILAASGIRRALVNAGGSSIASIGAPPGRDGWPVSLAARAPGADPLVLRDESVSSSQQQLLELANEPGRFGEIVDPATGTPADGRIAVSVIAPRAMHSDALATALVMLPFEEGAALIDRFPGSAAIWTSARGELTHVHRPSSSLER